MIVIEKIEIIKPIMERIITLRPIHPYLRSNDYEKSVHCPNNYCTNEFWIKVVGVGDCSLKPDESE